MASKKLERFSSIDQEILIKLTKGGITTVYDLLNAGELDISFRADLSVKCVQKLVSEISLQFVHLPSPSIDLFYSAKVSWILN